MKARWVFFVSARYLRTKRREKGHTAGLLSVVGIAAGVMTLIAVLAVMNGFQLGTIEDILEIGSFHLQVDAPDARAGAAVLEGLPGVRAAIPYAETHGLAYGHFPDPLAMLIRAVPSDLFDADQRLAVRMEIVSGRWDLDDGGIVLGLELARRLGARVGDTIDVVGFSGAFSAVAPAATTLPVTGVFRSGFLEYDGGWGFVGPGAAADALGLSPPARVGVKLEDRFRDRAVARRVETLLPESSVETWREYNRAIFGALRLEKTMMMLLIGLIFIVVAVNIYQSLRRSVVERTEEIAVLKALGSTPLRLQTVFVLEGLWIGLLGGGVGLVLGLAVARNINALFAAAEVVVNALAFAGEWLVALIGGGRPAPGSFSIFSPAYFYLEEVPAVLVPVEVAAIVGFAVLSSTVAAYAASRRVSLISPAGILRYE